MLQYEDINCKTIAILFCLFIIQLTVYNGTITRFIADDKVVYLLSVSEMRDAIGFRQQLSTTLFEAFELEVTVNYPTHTWTENRSFMRNLTSWSVPFWLVHLTDCYATNAVYTAACLPDNCIRLVDSFKQTVDASNFPTIVRKFTQRLLCTVLTDRDFKSESHLSVKFSWFCWIFTDS